MDLLVDNDTRGLHWTLKLSENRHLLAALFLDHKLFQTLVELLPAESSSPYPEIIYILEKLQDRDHYGMAKDGDNVKGEDNNMTGSSRNTKGTSRNTKGTGKNMKGNGKNMKKNDMTMNRKDSEYWLNSPSAIESEQNMAHFLNGIVDAVEKAMGRKILNKQ